MKNSIPLWVEFLGMGNEQEPLMPNAQCPKWRGGYPSTDTWGWSLPPLSMKLWKLHNENRNR
ncbi:MAG: hypothetical protein V7K98_04175 [Nostoc sp.]|uniref:hypothetical protein n=1 Tax=Nostoc sp. TaxID=1180 RepID=UPI002FF51F46